MKPKQIERAVVVSDLHIPFHDEQSVNAVLAFLKEFKPSIIFLNGDVIDHYSLSAYDRHPFTKVTLQSEMRDGRKFIEKIVKLAKKVVYVCGNHEYRFTRYLIRIAPELYGLEGLNLSDQLHLGEMGVELVDTGHKENY